jgi:hypothetical protein
LAPEHSPAFSSLNVILSLGDNLDENRIIHGALQGQTMATVRERNVRPTKGSFKIIVAGVALRVLGTPSCDRV